MAISCLCFCCEFNLLTVIFFWQGREDHISPLLRVIAELKAMVAAQYASAESARAALESSTRGSRHPAHSQQNRGKSRRF